MEMAANPSREPDQIMLVDVERIPIERLVTSGYLGRPIASEANQRPLSMSASWSPCWRSSSDAPGWERQLVAIHKIATLVSDILNCWRRADPLWSATTCRWLMHLHRHRGFCPERLLPRCREYNV
jgi:hypothetical protein